MKRFVYISAADFGVVNYLLQGYYEGKVSNSGNIFVSICKGQINLENSIVKFPLPTFRWLFFKDPIFHLCFNDL